MDHKQVARYWNENAEAWTRLSRAGYDVYRDYLNTPAFFKMAPPVEGLRGLDVGCGEGHNTRLLAQRGARMIAIDISQVFIRHARQTEAQNPQGIQYLIASGVELPFAEAAFDFVTAFMSLMDIGEVDAVFAQVHRVLRPGGFLQFSITHPCFDAPHRKKLTDERGVAYAFEIGGYFDNLEGEIDEWLFSVAPAEVTAGMKPFKIPHFTRTFSQWLNLLIETGFVLERVEEPRPDDRAVEACPAIQDAQVIPYFLHIRARKHR